jgi:hypothetical protein
MTMPPRRTPNNRADNWETRQRRRRSATQLPVQIHHATTLRRTSDNRADVVGAWQVREDWGAIAFKNIYAQKGISSQ